MTALCVSPFHLHWLYKVSLACAGLYIIRVFTDILRVWKRIERYFGYIWQPCVCLPLIAEYSWVWICQALCPLDTLRDMCQSFDFDCHHWHTVLLVLEIMLIFRNHARYMQAKMCCGPLSAVKMCTAQMETNFIDVRAYKWFIRKFRWSFGTNFFQ